MTYDQLHEAVRKARRLNREFKQLKRALANNPDTYECNKIRARILDIDALMNMKVVGI